MLRAFLQNIFATLVLSVSLVCAENFSYNSTLAEPEQMVLHIYQAYWLDAQGTKYPLLYSPVDLDITQGCSVDLSPALKWARYVGVSPVALIIESQRYFEAKGSAFIELVQDTAHTQENYLELNFDEIKHISLARFDVDEANLQTCWIPESTDINSMLNNAGVKVLPNGILSFQINTDALTSTTTNASVEFSSALIEFGTTQPGCPVFVVPHLPSISIVAQD